MTHTNSSILRTPVETGRAIDDSRAFRRCLGQYPTGVAVVTARLGDQRVGMAVNSFAAVSLDPPLVLWSIRCQSRSAPVFLEARHFAINVLAAEQVEVSQLFGASDPERFNRFSWSEGMDGLPLLDGAIAHLECRRQVIHEGGDHHILIGEVQRYTRFEGQPLLFTQGQYAVAKTHPCLPSSATALGHPLAESSETSFLRTLSSAHQNLSSQFDEHRLAFGVTVASGRVLSRLYEAPLGLDDLEHATYLSREAVEDAVRDLCISGLVIQAEDSCLALTPEGRHQRTELAKRAADFTKEKLAGIAEADIAIAQRVMRALQAK